MKYSDQAREIYPYLLPYLQRALRGAGNGSGGGGGSSSSTFMGLTDVDPLGWDDADYPRWDAAAGKLVPVALSGSGGAPSPHVLATGTALGVDHTISGAAAGQVLRALSATTAAFDVLAHGDLGGRTANDHHNEASSGNSAITVSAAQVISLFLNAAATDLEISSGLRLATTVAGAGLTIDTTTRILAVGEGDGITVTSGAVAVDVTEIIDTNFGITESSNNIRVMRATDSGLVFDTATGGQGLALGTPSGVSAISINHVTTTTHSHQVTSTSNVSAVVTPTLLESTSAGGLTLASLTVTGSVVIDQGLTAAATGFRVIHHTHDYDHAHVVINPGGLWTLDEQFGLDVDDNLLVRGWIVGKHAIQVEGALMLCHYDGPEPFETNFKGNPTGHMGQPGLSTGGVIYRPGKFQKAVQIAPATENHIDNPSFETGTTGWTHGQAGTGSSFAQSSTRSYVGAYSARLTGTTTGAASATSPAFNSVGSWYVTFQVRVWRADSTTVEVHLWDNTANVSRRQVDATLTEEWELIKGAWLNDTGGTAACAIRVRIVGGSNATEIWFDAVQAQRGATQYWISPYCDGSLGGYSASGVPDNSGHAWLGTAHNSHSTRVAATLTYPAAGNLRAERGSVMAWVNMLDLAPTVLQYIFSHFNSGNRVYLFVNVAGNWCVGLGSSATLIDSGIAAVRNTWTLLTMTWDGATCRLYINGGAGGLGGEPDASAAYSGLTAIGTTMYVGSNASGGETFNGWICEFSTLDRAFDGDEVRAIYESNAPIFAEASTWHFRAGRNRIYVDAEGLWGYGASGGTIMGLYAGDEDNPSATKSWGGMPLAEGDLLLGDANRGAYFRWDNSAANIIIGKEGVSSAALTLSGTDIVMAYNSVNRVLIDSNGIRFNDEAGLGRVQVDSSAQVLLKDGTRSRVVLTSAGLLTIRDSGGGIVFTFDASAGAEFTKPLTLGTAGGIYQGTGTFSSPTTGLKIFNSSGIGRIAGYTSGTEQWGATTTGTLTAGAGNVILSASGISVTGESALLTDPDYDPGSRAMRFLHSSAGIVGYLGSTYNGSTEGEVSLVSRPPAGDTGHVRLIAQPQGAIFGAGTERPIVDVMAGPGATYSSEVQIDGQYIGLGHSAGSPTEIAVLGIIAQSLPSAAIPVLQLRQDDVSEEFIEFIGTVSGTNPINTTALGAYYGRVRVSVNGTFKWLALYS